MDNPAVPETGPTHRWRAAERLLSLPDEWRILRRGDVAWLDPLPSYAWYRDFYNGRYYQELGRRPWPGTRSFEETRLRYYTARLLRAERHLGRAPRRILDIGSGDGAFLMAARLLGWPAAGVELSAVAAADARRCGLDVRTGDLVHEPPPLDPPYDVVAMNHVLEHVLVPHRYLAEVRALLAPDGVFVFEVPQQFVNPIDLAYRLVGFGRPFTVYSLHHPYFYRVSSITRLLEGAGFRIEALTTWRRRQVFHTEDPRLTVPLQGALWAADRLFRAGHMIDGVARPA